MTPEDQAPYSAKRDPIADMTGIAEQDLKHVRDAVLRRTTVFPDHVTDHLYTTILIVRAYLETLGLDEAKLRRIAAYHPDPPPAGPSREDPAD